MTTRFTIGVSGGRTIVTREATRLSRAPGFSRNFTAAKTDRFNSTWSTEVLTSDQALERDLRSIVARSREQNRNNNFVRHFSALAKVNIVGKDGVLLRPRPVTKKGEVDEQAKKAVLEAWRRWGLRENCDLIGRLSWVDQQNQAIGSCVSSGEFLARKIFGGSAGPFGFQLQIFDPLSLEPTFRKDLPNGHFIRLGIEFDPIGRVAGYWLRTTSPMRESSLPKISFGGSLFVRVPAAEMLHVFVPEELNQKRGIPWVATALMRLRMLDAYAEAALIAARAGANKVAFLSRKRNRGYRGPKESDGARIMNTEPGTIEEIEEGAQLLNFDPSYPHGDYDSFTKRSLQDVASGLLVSYSTLANDQEGSSFSSERSRKLAERDVWGMFQTWFIDHMVRPCYVDWLPFALANGHVRSGGRVYGPKDIERFLPVAFAPRTWPWAANPLQEVTAAEREVASGFRSIDDVRASIYGKDPAEVDDEIAAAQKRIEDKGIVLADPATVAIAIDPTKGNGNE